MKSCDVSPVFFSNPHLLQDKPNSFTIVREGTGVSQSPSRHFQSPEIQYETFEYQYNLLDVSVGGKVAVRVVVVVGDGVVLVLNVVVVVLVVGDGVVLVFLVLVLVVFL